MKWEITNGQPFMNWVESRIANYWVMLMSDGGQSCGPYFVMHPKGARPTDPLWLCVPSDCDVPNVPEGLHIRIPTERVWARIKLEKMEIPNIELPEMSWLNNE